MPGKDDVVGVARLERATSWSQTTRSSPLSYTPWLPLQRGTMHADDTQTTQSRATPAT